MTSFEDALAAEKSSRWQKDSTLVVKPESLQFTTDTSLKSRALGFAQLLLQDTGLDKTKNRLSSSKPDNDNADMEEADRNGLDYEDQDLEQKKDLSEGEATALENAHKDDFVELDVSQSPLQQKNPENVRKEASKDDETSFEKQIMEPTFSQEDLDKAISDARREGVEEGFKNGEKSGREEGISETERRLNEPLKKAQSEFKEFVDSITLAVSDKEYFFAPLKRLAMHLAQEIAKSEIKTSDVVITKLVENCLSELGTAKKAKITVSLHSGDLSSYKKHIHETDNLDIEVKTDKSLSSGSVRVSVNESIVEDLIENRIKKLSLMLLGEQRKTIAKAESGAEDNNQNNQHEKKQTFDGTSETEMAVRDMEVKDRDGKVDFDENENSILENSELSKAESNSNIELAEMPENPDEIVEEREEAPHSQDSTEDTASAEISEPKEIK
ncbi:MAG: hypothetical protein CMK56_01690 [Proteobacteria bacterium]|nr:hypothetical protein [Pseudomonadota bacterium]